MPEPIAPLIRTKNDGVFIFIFLLSVSIIFFFALPDYMIIDRGALTFITIFGITWCALFLIYGTSWYYQLHSDKWIDIMKRNQAQDERVLEFLHLRKREI